MAEPKKVDVDNQRVVEEMDEETLAAMDEGIRDCEAGRVVPLEEVRKMLPKWIARASKRRRGICSATDL